MANDNNFVDTRLTNSELRNAIKDTQLEVRNSKRYPSDFRSRLSNHLYYLLNEEYRRAVQGEFT